MAFQPTLNSGFPLLNPNQTRRDVAEFMHAMDSDLAPVVGQQVTLSADAGQRLANVAGQEVTYTCAPPGSGRRIAAVL